MGTIVVVHGAGVRADGIAQLKQQVSGGIAQVDNLASFAVEMCEYGPNVGAAPVRVADTLPPEVASRALGDAPDADEEEAALWSLLFDDALFELRVAAAGAPAAGGVVIGAALPSEDLRSVVLGLKAQDDLPTRDTGISRSGFAAAVDAVASSRELRDAATAIGNASDGDLVTVTARAIVATIITGHRHDAPGTLPPMVSSGTTRNAFVALIADRLVPATDRSFVSDRLKRAITGFIASRATSIAVDRRAGAQEAASLVVGDVLHYIRRPDDMANFVRDCLKDRTPPVIALGHSLGGIILVDVLSGAGHPPVDLLVTVGSQSPILFAYDALGRPRGGPAPGLPYSTDNPPFTPWLNIYNRNDFVSFRAREIFRNELSDQGLDIEDQELHLPHAFPAAHGDYWTDKWTYEFIGDRVGRLRVAGRPTP